MFQERTHAAAVAASDWRQVYVIELRGEKGTWICWISGAISEFIQLKDPVVRTVHCIIHVIIKVHSIVLGTVGIKSYSLQT